MDDLVVTCDETEDTPESTIDNLGDGIDYWLIVQLAITYLLLLVNFVVKYYVKHGLIILCLLLH